MKTKTKLETHNAWVVYDVALEIMGKMVAEQTIGLHSLLNTYQHIGYDMTNHTVQSDEAYKQYMQRISELNTEIRRLYSEKNPIELLQKIHNVYAPYVKARLSLQQAQITA